jgi:hypothetical protein
MIYFPVTAVLALAVLAGAVLLARARAARRWSAALDHYADREIARSTHPDAPARGPTFHRPHSRTAPPRAAFFRSKTHERQR